MKKSVCIPEGIYRPCLRDGLPLLVVGPIAVAAGYVSIQQLLISSFQGIESIGYFAGLLFGAILILLGAELTLRWVVMRSGILESRGPFGIIVQRLEESEVNDVSPSRINSNLIIHRKGRRHFILGNHSVRRLISDHYYAKPNKSEHSTE